MEQEKDRHMRELRAKKDKVIQRSLNRCFKPPQENYSQLPYYKITQMQKQEREERKEILSLFSKTSKYGLKFHITLYY